MNILQIANKATYPPDGGSLAILGLAKAYASHRHHVKILNMTTHKHQNSGKALENKYENYIETVGVNLNTKISFIKLLLNYIFSSKAYIAERFFSKKFSFKIIELLKNNSFDFIQIEGLYVLQYIHIIKKHFQGIVVYRPHNIEYTIWERNYKTTKSLIKKYYFKSLYRRLRKLELYLLNSYDLITPISFIDSNKYKALGNTKPLITSPFGVDFEEIKRYIRHNNSPTYNSINFIGALDWIPNQEGLLWFIDNCFPLILKKIPNTKLNIAGRNAPSRLINKFKKKNISYYGEVDNAYDFIQNSGPLIVPLFAGSGMRVKIIESMALKKTIIATDVAAEGIKCKDKTHILLANDANSFANSVITVLNNPDIEQEIGENAFNFVIENYDSKKIALSILEFIKQQ